MISCAELSTLLEPFLALDLPPAVESEVRLHLAGCASCRAAVDAVEPAAGIGLRLASVPGESDEDFVSGVLAGMRQHRLERRLAHRWRRWLGAAAAIVFVVLGGYVGLREQPTEKRGIASVALPNATAEEPAFVEVEGDGVTVYQLTSPMQDSVQVALIVDPRLEL